MANELYDRYQRIGYPCTLLTKAQCLDKYPSLRPDYVLGGLFFPQEMSVEPEQMIHRLLAFVQQQHQVDYRPGSVVVDCEPTGGGAVVRLANGSSLRANGC